MMQLCESSLINAEINVLSTPPVFSPCMVDADISIICRKNLHLLRLLVTVQK